MAATPHARLTVLVVDDEAGMRALVRRCLLEYCEVLEAASGEEALRLDRSIDLLITDEMMPEMVGHELARRFRIRHPAIMAGRSRQQLSGVL